MQAQGEVVEEVDAGRDRTDAFEDTGAKLAALLDLPPSARTLLIGTREQSRLSDLGRSFRGRKEYADAETALSELRSGTDLFDLIVWSPGRSAGGDGMTRLLASVKGLLAREGVILLLVRNRFGLRGARTQPSTLWDRSSRSRGQYRALVRSAGFASIEEFLPFPNANAPEEMVAAGGALALPGYASLVEHGLNALGLLPRFHDSFAYLLSNGSPGVDRTVARLSAGILADGVVRYPLRLERFAMRPRGAMVLFLEDPVSGRRVLCRVTTSAAVNRIVRMNAHWTRVLHSSPTLSPAARALVPAPLGEVVLGSHRAYLEELLPGVVAWKLAVHRRLERLFFIQACDFLRDLGKATAESRLLTEEALNAVLPLPRHPWLDPEFSSLLSDLRAQLVRRVEGTVRTFTLSHGDFGYGNLLATRRGNRITGAFDWDQARIDVDGVDLVNFLVQRHRMKMRVALATAVQQIGDVAVEQGFSGVDRALDREARNHRERTARAELLAWSIWRFVERDTRYRREYERGRDQLAASLRWAIRTIAQ